MKPRLSVRERLSVRRALIGLIQTHPNPPLAEMAGMCGYDFLMLDCEHGWFSEMELLQTMQAIGSTEIAALVRLRGHDLQALGRYMDMGVDGIIVPNVGTADQARALVRAMVYPPAGTRGFAAPAHRASGYGLNLAAHMKSPRDRVCLVVIIESGEGVANAADIAAVEGVDGVFIGPADLSADLGCAGDYTQPAYQEALARIERAANRCGKLVGTAPHPGQPLEALVARGYRLLIVSGDMPLIREAMSDDVAKAKSCLEGGQA